MTLHDLVFALAPVLVIAGIFLIHTIYHRMIASTSTQLTLDDERAPGAGQRPVKARGVKAEPERVA